MPGFISFNVVIDIIIKIKITIKTVDWHDLAHQQQSNIKHIKLPASAVKANSQHDRDKWIYNV